MAVNNATVNSDGDFVIDIPVENSDVSVTLQTQDTYLDRNIIFNVNKSGIDISDTTLTAANQLLYGYSAYKADGTKINGSYKVQTNKATVTPTASQQTISPDSGYNALSQVIVGAIPNTYTANTKIQSSKTVTPTSSSQTVNPDSGYSALSKVVVNAIPDTYTANTKIQSSKSVTPTAAQQTVKPDTNYSALSQVVVNAAPLETKTITPSTSSQTASPSSGKIGFSSVTVNAIPSNYIVPSGNYNITSNGTNINVAQYATVSVAVSAQQTTFVSSTEPSVKTSGTVWIHI